MSLPRRELEGKAGVSGKASGDDDNDVSDESVEISGPRSSSATKVRSLERWHAPVWLGWRVIRTRITRCMNKRRF